MVGKHLIRTEALTDVLGHIINSWPGCSREMYATSYSFVLCAIKDQLYLIIDCNCIQLYQFAKADEDT